MRSLRAIVAVALLAVAVYVGYRLFVRHSAPRFGDTIVVYFTKTDGETLGKWNVSLSPNARDLASVAFYATAQAVAGPPPDVTAVRFPSGTIARSARVSGSIATVDLGGAIRKAQDGSFGESGEFKALVWTLTSLPGVKAVQVELDGARVATLPGGHLELDEPLTRQSW
ncbi:MAG: GerMN domain-containing protein [Candidatus Eremiobacteraeota bacterium]|nr:GerMN domain-containing protein [Candidatus Eremiobacteraeota bacterium]